MWTPRCSALCFHSSILQRCTFELPSCWVGGPASWHPASRSRWRICTLIKSWRWPATKCAHTAPWARILAPGILSTTWQVRRPKPLRARFNKFKWLQPSSMGCQLILNSVPRRGYIRYPEKMTSDKWKINSVTNRESTPNSPVVLVLGRGDRSYGSGEFCINPAHPLRVLHVGKCFSPDSLAKWGWQYDATEKSGWHEKVMHT